MQTFLPLPSLSKSAKALDWKRLGKQRVECLQILRILHSRDSGGYVNHPAVLMWKGYEEALAAYYNCCIREWISRGYNNNLIRWYIEPGTELQYPKWFGGKIHSNHRLALMYKAQLKAYHTGKHDEIDWYDQFNWQEEPDHSEIMIGDKFAHYYWPVRKK